MSPAAVSTDTQGDFGSTHAAPITLQKPTTVDLDKHIKNPGAGQATRAISKEKPEGVDNGSRTVLQQHHDYFDFDKDGVIWPIDTYTGFHRIGFNAVLSFIAVFVVHPTFAYWSQDSWIPNPLLPIYTKNAHRLRHGSDSQVYDSEGRFVPQKFEDLFAKFDKDGKGGLALRELIDMGITNRKIMDPVGWSAAIFEWGATWWLLADKKGVVSKEKIRGVYDASLFYQLDAENEQKQASKLRSKKMA